MSKIITLNAAGTDATIADAKIGDLFTTLLSSDKTLTGTYGFLQKLLLVAVGMGGQSYRDGKGFLGFLSFT